MIIENNELLKKQFFIRAVEVKIRKNHVNAKNLPKNV